jgi:hypothetical protein
VVFHGSIKPHIFVSLKRKNDMAAYAADQNEKIILTDKKILLWERLQKN